MSAAHCDHPTARFLYAILKQKNLKDIDWNKVASDDVLTQPISNGHAARMRFSRMRTVMQNIESQQRGSATGPPKSKVTKSKKESRAKREPAMKQDPASQRNDSPPVKEETSQIRPESHVTMGSIAVTAADMHPQLRGRLLTPCSDDFMATPHGYHASPASDIFQADTPFDFSPTAPCPHEQEACWPQPTAYPGYEAVPYELHSYAAAFEEDHHLAQQHHVNSALVPSDALEHDLGREPIKHEDWDTHSHEI